MAVDLIERAFAWEALDSRGTPTVACAVVLESGAEGEATVPSGASTGTHEAHERRDGGERYGGKGVRDAVAAFRAELAPALAGRDAGDHAAIDAAMRELDGTPSLERLGANAVLAASVACALAAAASQGVPLWRALGDDGAAAAAAADGERHLGRRARRRARRRPGPPRRPRRRAHVRRGDRVGRARPRRRPRTCSASAGTTSRSSRTKAASRRASARIARRSSSSLEGIERSGLAARREAAIAVDVAATQLLGGDRYELASEGRELSRRRARRRDRRLVSTTTRSCRSRIRVGEDDEEGWRDASERLAGDVQLLGDDLFVTSPERLAAGIATGSRTPCS